MDVTEQKRLNEARESHKYPQRAYPYQELIETNRGRLLAKIKSGSK